MSDSELEISSDDFEDVNEGNIDNDACSGSDKEIVSEESDEAEEADEALEISEEAEESANADEALEISSESEQDGEADKAQEIESEGGELYVPEVVLEAELAEIAIEDNRAPEETKTTQLIDTTD